MRKTQLSYPSLIFAVLFTLVTAFLFTTQSQAAEVQTTYLHKRVAINDKSAAADLLQDTKGINGVEYTIVDITSYVRNHPTSLTIPLDTAKELTKENVAGVAVGEELPTHLGMKVVGREVTSRMSVPDKQGKNTDTDGVIKLSLNKKSGNYDASYLFIETASVSEASASDNLIIHLPVRNEETGDELGTDGPLHVYSKNDGRLVEPAEPGITKELIEQQSDFAYGETISYQLSLNIPSSIETFQKFQIVDTPDPQLEANLESIQVSTKDGKEVPKTIYTLASQENGFVMDFNPQVLSPYQGETLVITYQMKLQAGAEPDKQFVNKATLHYNDSTKDEELSSSAKPVITGGYRFVKVDANARDKKLEKAVFVVKNEKNEYLDKDYAWKKTDDAKNDDQLFRTTSNKDGYFEVKGLRYGTYMIEEIQAPDGYSRPDKAVSFKVEKNTYTIGSDAAALLEVLNSKLPNTGGNETEKGNTSSTKTSASKNLPSTGETIKNGGVVGGLIILGVSIVFVLKKKKID